MGDFIQIQPEGQEEVWRAFESLDARISNMRPSWPGVADEVRKVARGSFAAEGPGWEDLTEAYARRKAARYGSQKILHASGAYEASLAEEGAKFAIYEEAPDSLTMGSSHPAALAHEEGVLERSLPARPVFPEDDEELERRVTGVIERDLTAYAEDLGLAA